MLPITRWLLENDPPQRAHARSLRSGISNAALGCALVYSAKNSRRRSGGSLSRMPSGSRRSCGTTTTRYGASSIQRRSGDSRYLVNCTDKTPLRVRDSDAEIGSGYAPVGAGYAPVGAGTLVRNQLEARARVSHVISDPSRHLSAHHARSRLGQTFCACTDAAAHHDAREVSETPITQRHLGAAPVGVLRNRRAWEG